MYCCVWDFFPNNWIISQNLVLLHILKIATPILLCAPLLCSQEVGQSYKQCFIFTDETMRYNRGTATLPESFWKSIMRQAINCWGQGLLSAALVSSAAFGVGPNEHIFTTRTEKIFEISFFPHLNFDTWQTNWMTRKYIKWIFPLLREVEVIPTVSTRRRRNG